MSPRCPCRATTLSRCEISRQQDAATLVPGMRPEHGAVPERFLRLRGSELCTASRAGSRATARAVYEVASDPDSCRFHGWRLLAALAAAMVLVSTKQRGLGCEARGGRHGLMRRTKTSADARPTGVSATRSAVAFRSAKVHAEGAATGPGVAAARLASRPVSMLPRPRIDSEGPATQARQTAHIRWPREDPPTRKLHDEVRDGWTSTERQ